MSSNVSSVAGILTAGQTGNVNTGSKEGDLKVQFQEVMSQMTTQVGTGSENSNTYNGKPEKTVDATSQTDSYEQYQYRESGIKKQSETPDRVEEGKVEKQLDSFENNVKEVLKEELGVTDEQIEAAMEKLGMTAIDLIDPKQLASLVTELTGCQDVGELLCNNNFLDILKEVGVLTEDLLKELGVTGEELKEVYQVLQEQTEDIMPGDVSNEMDVEVAMPSDVVTQPEVETKQQTKQPDAVQPAEKEAVTADKVTKETATVTVGKNTEKNVTETETAEEQTEEEPTADNLTAKKTETPEQQTGSQLNQQNHGNETVTVQVNTTQQTVNAGTTEVVTEFTKQLDTENIIKQIVEFTKINVSDAQTTMEMQLNPENLGKIYLEVTSKEGTVSARIVAQNEFVREALETQIVELKQNMNQAGIKVDAVEVTVGSHEFEKNLEQNQKQEEQQAEEREKASGKTRRLNLNDLDELAGVMTEEENLVAQMMADQGNSIDYTA